ncbi:N2227-domain-containing protein [Fomitiporia mediterranea MF3/22]|uniref:N2227-domain-containing protein n=1 Tax=Fomitiporia mediterranea (strain MF3/22) TaxID=694068 RepID=UPI00044078CF|nr:N2227-domain-containing protein [Fomitiporia mediterranea MF3/22]EJD08181.1 N2227-domain-containing protein [Fomitiporia mediterranea MF3/22]
MSSTLQAALLSDAFLHCILLLVISMLGLKFLPFSFSNFKTRSLRNTWKQLTLAHTSSTMQSQLERAVSAFYHYEQLSLEEIYLMQRTYSKVNRAHKRLGYEIGYPAKLEQLKEVTKANAILTRAIAKMGMGEAGIDDADALPNGTSIELRDVREALRHFVRDWSDESIEERNVVMKPILEVFERVRPERRKTLKVLVPGCGLGRLAWEISELGFASYANELSSFMNLSLRFLLSPHLTRSTSQHTLHPYAHWSSHQRTNANLFRSISFPDVLPRLSNTFKHISGDFLTLGPANSYDFIVTQFFIDTSYNIISTIEQIHSLLRPAGTWINLGPLLWRSGGQAALELSLDELVQLVEKIGFIFVTEGKCEEERKKTRTVECEYTADREAMMRWIYKAEFWVAEKKAT